MLFFVCLSCFFVWQSLSQPEKPRRICGKTSLAFWQSAYWIMTQQALGSAITQGAFCRYARGISSQPRACFVENLGLNSILTGNDRGHYRYCCIHPPWFITLSSLISIKNLWAFYKKLRGFHKKPRGFYKKLRAFTSPSPKKNQKLWAFWNILPTCVHTSVEKPQKTAQLLEFCLMHGT